MTVSREQLEAVVERQLSLQLARPRLRPGERKETLIDASARAILAAVDDWAAGQVAAAVTPPAVIPVRRKLTRRALRQLRRQFLAAQGGPVTVLPDDDQAAMATSPPTRYWVLISDSLWDDEPTWPEGFRPVHAGGRDSAHAVWWLFEDEGAPAELEGKSVDVIFASEQDGNGNRHAVISERRVLA